MTAPSVRLRLTRRGRLVLATLVSLPLIAALVAFAILGGSQAMATGEGTAVTYSYVTVQPGESLWGIAQTLDPSADPRDVIADIVNLNQLQSSDVHSGQRLALPPQYAK
ncbi:LysM peptidoglycan-binding domain-containing protein [Subtercola sp. YIM 133946]|uniref:LysM peptidoglycan-binding domain-containing protein n=1 Tax=Subtercola sp. YIM 133946 TaxID=3118909 RepID=UPI002F93992D